MPLPDFHDSNDPIGDNATVGEFWRWAMSDLLGNRNRGVLAEFLVAKALGDETLRHPRIEWDCYDVEYRGYWIEVKSSAYIQTWHSKPEQRSQLSFSIGSSNCWDARTNTYSDEKKRHAHLYVFCVFPSDREIYTRDVLDLDQWAFYITTTTTLETYINADQTSIGIAAVRQICGSPVPYRQMKSKIDDLLNTLS